MPYMLSVCLPGPVCLSVTFVYCGQTVGRIKMKLGMQVSLSPKGAETTQTFGPYLLRPNGCMDQDVTWYGAIDLGPGNFVLDGKHAPLPKRGRIPLPNFRPISIVAKRLDVSRCHLVWM